MTVVLLTFDRVGANLTGAAIRVLELARALASAGHEVSMLTPDLDVDRGQYPFPIHRFDSARARATLLPLVRDARVLVLPLHALVRVPELASTKAALVFDIYDPFVFELLTSGGERPIEVRRREIRAHCSIVNHVLRRGDFFLCASERQRDMWLGALVASGRIVPSANGDADFRNLIDVVPIGIPDTPPTSTSAEKQPLRNSFPVIRQSDTVIISSGVLWDWQDPVTAVRAMANVAASRRDIHLVFLAGAPPAGSQPASAALSARDAATELGVSQTNVHFIEQWIPYSQRGSYLCDANAGITTHRRGIESHFSFRTRVLDYLWAGLPVVCTEGDVLSELVGRRGLGIVVPEQDAAALARALERIADDRDFVAECRRRIAEVRPQFLWKAAAAPLIRFCENPQIGERMPGGVAAARDLAASAWRVLRSEGLREVARRVHRHGFLRQ